MLFLTVIFFGSSLSPSIARLIGQKGGVVLFATLSALSSAAVLHTALDSELNPRISLGSLSWFTVEHANVAWEVSLDSFTLTMLTAVAMIGSFVTLYSGWYMLQDPGVLRFSSLVLLFIGFMGLLVMAKTLVVLFLGWEGIGAISFLLISFWQTRVLAAQASMQAFLLNRVGDMLIVLAMIMFLLSTSAWGMALIPELTSLGNTAYTSLGMIFILGGAMGKSAQIGLHAWLPNAMEAPTPVSALIHAATLVTAGVYLLSRLGGCLMETEGAFYTCLVGAYSLTFAGLIGLTQTDLKRVIAFSTMSQVGYMVLGCGVGAFQASVFLLFTHAFYKALLFLGAGAVIHATANIQDTRSMGAEGIFVPVTKSFFIAASLALGASPFTSGDFSKDVLIELTSCTQFSSKNMFWCVAVGGAGLTTVYTGRLIRLVFAAEARGPHPNLQHELPFYLTVALTLLATLSVAGGYVAAALYELGHLSALADLPSNSAICAVEYQASSLALNLPLLCGAVGLITGAGGLNLVGPNSFKSFFYLSTMSQTQGGWSDTFPRQIIASFIHLTSQMRKYQDTGLLEVTGPSGLASLIYTPYHKVSSRSLYKYITYLMGIILLSALASW